MGDRFILIKGIPYFGTDSSDMVLTLLEIILDILAQYNRPKFIPTCTSSLGFSCLYIPMLWFIVTHVLYYTLI